MFVLAPSICALCSRRLPTAGRPGHLPLSRRACPRLRRKHRSAALWAQLEGVGMSIEMTAGVMVANMLEGMHFALGPTMAVRSSLRAADGRLPRRWASIARTIFCWGIWSRRRASRRAFASRYRPHRAEYRLHRFHPSSGSLEQEHALLPPQGTLRHVAHLQHALWPARIGCGARRALALWSPLLRWRGAIATRMLLAAVVGAAVVQERSLPAPSCSFRYAI